MGQTRDDAAGEAFDKIAKLMGLGYPGGRVIEELARSGNPDRFKFPRALLNKGDFDFSFSGIKTAVARCLRGREDHSWNEFADVAAGFQEAVVDVLVHKAFQATEGKDCRHLAVVGGVAANGRLRQRIEAEGARKGVRVHIPGFALCSDNAAMIAAVGHHKLLDGSSAGLDLDAYSKSCRP